MREQGSAWRFGGLKMSLWAMTVGLLMAGPVVSAPPEESAAPAAAARKPIYDEAADGKQQVAEAVALAKSEHKRVLVKFGGNWCGWCYKLHDVFTQDEETRSLLASEYVLVLVDVNNNRELFESYGEENQRQGFPFLTVLDEDGNVVVNQNTADLEDGPKHDVEKVRAFLTKWTPAKLDAEVVLNDAVAKARTEDKLVLVHIGAPWCGWCNVLGKYLHAERDLFAKHFVVTKVDRDRMTHGPEVAKRLRKEQSGGIPWMAILDHQGEILTTSDGPEGNIGYPARPQEIDYFLEMLRSTATNMTAEELARVEETLRDNAVKLGIEPQPAAVSAN